MIRELRVLNLALIDDIAVVFSRGFNVFTGETGAGKSILMDAIGLLAGERAYSEQVRGGATDAEVSGVFDISGCPAAAAILRDNTIPCDEQTVIIRRRIQREGRNRIHLNDTPVSLGLLKQLGDALVDLHGQHEHQSLLREESARETIDTLSGVQPAAEAYAAAWNACAQAQQQLSEHERRATLLAERRDVLEFQRKEIESLQLSPGEESRLEAELSLRASSTRRAACAGELSALLRGNDTAIEQTLSAVHKRLQELARLDAQASCWLQELEPARVLLSELASYCESYLESVNGQADPGRVEAINERLARLQRLKKKYGCGVDELIHKLASVTRDLDNIENSDAERQQLQRQAHAAREVCETAAATLRAARRKSITPFDRCVTGQMARVGFSDAAWQTSLTPSASPGPHGSEQLQFMVRTNPGEPFLPLARSASGGEISRMMLAVKSVLAARDRVAVLVFDEIDSGIGGTVAHRIADSLLELSKTHQLLCISHLHQIASLADSHYQVSKQVAGARTVTRVKKLSAEERVDELARMLGGVTDMTRAHARELLKR